MLRKTDPHQYYFDVQLNWQGGCQGIVTANDVKDVIRVATPEEFTGGIPGMWSPEHLFLSSLCSCLMTTFFSIAAKRKLAVTHFECNAIGHVQLREGRLVFSTIDIYPKVFVEKDQDIALAGEILAKANTYCIVANSISATIIHHGQVLTDDHPVSRDQANTQQV